jgi:hypothetical protein
LFPCTIITKFQSLSNIHNQMPFCCFTESGQRSTAYAEDDGVQNFPFSAYHFICFVPFCNFSTSPKHWSLPKGSTTNICRELPRKQLGNSGRTWRHGRGISKSTVVMLCTCICEVLGWNRSWVSSCYDFGFLVLLLGLFR